MSIPTRCIGRVVCSLPKVSMPRSKKDLDRDSPDAWMGGEK
jgi:hypothetical protein